MTAPMQTPSLRLRVTGVVMIIWVVLILSLDVFVFLSLRSQLLDSLDDLLETRAQLATELGANLSAADLDDRLTTLGIPAIVVGADGTRLTADPAVPGFGIGPPGPRDRLGDSYVEREVVLDSGVRVTVLATRAGVERTMDQVLVLEAIGTIAVVVLMLVLLLRVSRVLLDPIDQVVATARRIASGRSGERLRPDRPETELGRMAVAFDEMLDSLEQALDEANRSAEESRESEARSRQFLADAAHQLRTPIAGLRASVESLLRTTDPLERDRLLDNLARETARTGRLVNSLLRVAELDRKETVEQSHVDLNDLVEAEVNRAQGLAPTLTIAISSPSEAPMVLANADDLSEVIANILDNARRHAKESITVHVSVHGEFAEVAVRDDGKGVDEGLEQRVFDRFATFDGRGGSGLGLAISRSIVRSHGGDVFYQDGSFVLRLPRELDR